MPSTGAQVGPLVTTPILPPKPTTMFRNSVRALEPLELTLMCPTALQVDTSDAFLVSRTFSAPGTGATATTQEISPTATATETTTIRVCSMAYLKDKTRLSERTPTKQLPLLF
jgi:hypothetical protein